MKKTLKFLLIFLLLISFNKIYALDEDDIELFPFIKQDEDGNPINDAKFVQVTLSGLELRQMELLDESDVAGFIRSAPTVTVVNESQSYYSYVSAIYDTDTALAILTSEQKSIIDNLKTIEDYNVYKEVFNKSYGNTICEGKDALVNLLKQNKGIFYSEGTPIVENSSINNKYSVKKLQSTSIPDIESIELNIITFSIIEETKTPVGLNKEIMIVPMWTTISYVVEPDGKLSISNAVSNNFDSYTLLKFNKDIDYNNVSDVYDKMSDEYVYNTCSNTGWISYNCSESETAFNKTPLVKKMQVLEPPLDTTPESECSIYPVVVDEKNREDLTKKVEITTYVNGKEEVTVKKNEEVLISVKVYNGSKTALHKNKIVSKLPMDLTYMEGTDLKGGIYNKDDRTVTWNLDYLDSYNAEIFSYKVKATNDINTGNTYKTSAYITYSGAASPIVSADAKVNMTNKVVNPNTGSISEQLLLILLSLSVLIVLIISGKKIIKST